MPKKEMESIVEREQRAAEAKRKSFVDVLSEPEESREPEASKARGRKAMTSGEKLIQRSYYITEKQYRELKMSVAMGHEKDISAIIRAAIDLYLEKHLYNTINL